MFCSIVESALLFQQGWGRMDRIVHSYQFLNVALFLSRSWLNSRILLKATRVSMLVTRVRYFPNACFKFAECSYAFLTINSYK